MAKNSIIDSAIDKIDAQIADLERAKEIIRSAAGPQTGETDAPKPRKARKKRGLPTTDAEALKF